LPILRAEIAFVSATPWCVWIAAIAIHSPLTAVD
jgi:hypothetical protein